MGEMGKAMMGTGEASGERRAVMAAEAAIANPLLDETSMKGARGLLISITGGNDLTLYEVDEAASRIRQEVDEEANIILGATFDSALDGVVRVSVVATGIDQATIDQIEPVGAPPLAEAAARARVVPPRPLPAAITPEEPVKPAPLAASALDDVEIRPAAPRSTAYVQPLAPAHEEETIEREFIPPAPEQPPLRAPRMPQIEELPPIAQNQLRVHRGEAPSAPPPVETRRRSLLEKLAAFGVSRHDDNAPAPRAIPAPVPLAPPRPTAAAVHAEYGRPQPRPAAPRPVQGQLDPHGRAPGRPASLEDDQLEIPAFLRRQSN
jgi:cell division protein FtsZ